MCANVQISSKRICAGTSPPTYVNHSYGIKMCKVIEKSIIQTLDFQAPLPDRWDSYNACNLHRA